MPEEEVEFNSKVKVLQDLEIKEKNISPNMRLTRKDDARDKSLAYFVTADVEKFFTMTIFDAEAEAERERLRLLHEKPVVSTDWNVQAVVNEDDL